MTGRATNWCADRHTPDRCLPVDLTTTPGDCPAVHSDGWLCTRNAGHTGRHAAGNGDVILAVWGGAL